MTDAPGLRLRTLGELRLIGGDSASTGRRKELVLLAYLARRSPRLIRREELIGLLWDERDEVRARQSLRQALLHLRRAVGVGLVVNSETVALADGTLELDANAFDAECRAGRTRDAVSRWAGDFLIGTEDVGGEAYRHWLETERAALRRRLDGAFDQLATDAIAAGDWPEAARIAEQWADVWPADVEPSDELRGLQRRLGHEARRAAPIDASHAGSAALFTPDLIGRETALRELEHAWRATQSGESVTVVIEGGEGIGKTMLCDRFLQSIETAAEQPLVLRGRAREADRAIAWKTASDLLAPLADAPGLGGASPRALAEISRIMPALTLRFPGICASTDDDRRLASATAEALAVVAEEKPVIVIVDDLPHADAKSLDLIVSLARHAPSGVLLLVAAQPTWLAPSRALAELCQLPRVRRLILRPLSVSEIESLVRSMITVDAAADVRRLASRLHAETGGNPFYVVETMSAMVDEGHLLPDGRGVWRTAWDFDERSLPLSSSVRDAVGRRLSRLSAEAKEVASAAAESNEPSPRDALRTRSGLVASRFEAALDELVSRRLLRPATTHDAGDDVFEFSHPIVRRIAYDRLGAHRAKRSAPPRRRWTKTAIVAAAADVMPAVPARWLAVAGTAVAMLALGIAAVLPWTVNESAPLVAVGLITNETGAGLDETARLLPGLLATDLARVRGLSVVSQTRLVELIGQTGRREETARALADAARRAGATELIEGALYRRRGELRLDLRRVDLASGVLRQSYSASGPEAFELADRATADIARDLSLVAPATPLAITGTGSLVARRFYEEGLRPYYRGEWRSAYELFSTALAEDSSFAMAAYYAAMSIGHFRVDSQVVLLVKAEQLAHRAPERDRLLIKYERHFSDYALRAAVAESLTLRFPEEPVGHLAMADLRISAGDFVGALPYARRVILMDSLSLQGSTPVCRACEAFHTLLNAYAAIGIDSFPAIERVAREWIHRQPGSTSPWQALAVALAWRGRNHEAMEALSKATQLQPMAIPSAIFLSAVIGEENYREAERLLRDRLRFDESDVEAIWWLVIALRNQGRIREALSLAEKANQLVSSGAAAEDAVNWAQAVAQLQFELERFRESGRRFQALMHVGPNDPRDRGYAARRLCWTGIHAATSWAAVGDTQRLSALGDSIERVAPLSAYGRDWRLSHHARGLLWRARGETARAVEEFRAAIFSPTAGYTRTNLELARALMALGRPREAIQVLREALAGPSDGSGYYLTRTEVHEWLARGFEAAAQRDSAVIHYQRVAEAWKNGDPPYQARAKAAQQKVTALSR